MDVNELKSEMIELLNERDELVDYANDIWYNYDNVKKKDKLELLESITEWFVDHSERMDAYRDKVFVYENEQDIIWN